MSGRMRCSGSPENRLLFLKKVLGTMITDGVYPAERIWDCGFCQVGRSATCGLGGGGLCVFCQGVEWDARAELCFGSHQKCRASLSGHLPVSSLPGNLSP